MGTKMKNGVARVDTAWFRNVLGERQMSQRKLARAMNLDPSAVSMMLRGMRSIRLEEAKKLSDILSVPLRQVLLHVGLEAEEDEMRMAPVAGTIDGAGQVHWEKTKKHVEAPADVPPDTLVLLFNSAGTPLAAFDGWLVYTPSSKGRVDDCVNRVSIVQPRGKGRPVIGYVTRGLKRGTWNIDLLPSGSGPVLENVLLEWGTPVLWIRP